MYETDPWLEEQRKTRAQTLGLPEDTSWQEIYFIEDEQERALVAEALGLPPPSEHVYEAKRKGLTDSVYPSWRKLLTEVLDLAPNVPGERIAKRIKELGLTSKSAERMATRIQEIIKQSGEKAP